MINSIKKCLLMVMMIASVATAQEQNLLEKDDIRAVMQEILGQHVDKKEMTTDILRTSLQNYIDQFDPDRIYLLDYETKSFLDMKGVALNKALVDYRRNQFTVFSELDALIQRAILRAQNYRKQFERNVDGLFYEADDGLLDEEWRLSDIKRSFPRNTSVLKQRVKDEILAFISSEQKRFGEESVNNNKERTIHTYEDTMQHHENRYLYLDVNGYKLAQKERENQFVLHVLKALSRSLDSHTTFFNPEEAYDMKVRLEKGFEGIGVVLQRKPQGVVITKLIKEGPAERSGKVKADDLIVGVNGINVEDDSLEELIEKLRDHTQPTTSIVVARDEGGREKRVSVVLQREQISLNDERVDVSFEKYQDGIIGKLRLHSFYQGDSGITSEKDLRKAILELKEQGKMYGLILDLRENSGGFLTQAVKVAGLFITNGVVVISKYSDGQERFYRDMDGKTSFDGPLIVLTSRATASAAEIVAQAIQDYGVGVVVGDEQTYGKGTIQSQTVTDNNSQSFFKVTVGKYYTVSGKTPQMQGVKADIVVSSQLGDEKIGEAFLEYPIGFDTIDPAFHDELIDIEAGLKPWYSRYYMPSLQKKNTQWHALLPGLRKNSEKRLSHNLDYESYLREEGKWSFYNDDDDKGEDPQMVEATHILRDMIKLDREENVASSKQ